MDSGLIDIHSHILYGVDDGASSREVSIEMLREAAKQGVTDIIALHYRQECSPIRRKRFSLIIRNCGGKPTRWESD